MNFVAEFVKKGLRVLVVMLKTHFTGRATRSTGAAGPAKRLERLDKLRY